MNWNIGDGRSRIATNNARQLQQCERCPNPPATYSALLSCDAQSHHPTEINNSPLTLPKNGGETVIAANRHGDSVSPRRLIRATELAEMLSVSPRTINRMLSSGRLIPPIRLGGSVRWRLDEVERWIAEGCPVPDAA